MTSKIEWTEETWNPVIGCTKVSAGCKYCYAEVMAERLKAMGHKDYANGFREVKMLEHKLDVPLRRKKPTTYFVNSMSDLFHNKVKDAFIERIIGVMEQTLHHRYQVLTKRSARMKEFFAKRKKPLPNNVWLGVTVEDKRHGLPRIDDLREVPCAVRFLSVEPLLEDLGLLDLCQIHWVIVGGESGHKARPMRQEWAIAIQKQCRKQKTAFFFKQWGTWGADNKKRAKHLNGRKLLGKTWDALPAINL